MKQGVTIDGLPRTVFTADYRIWIIVRETHKE